MPDTESAVSTIGLGSPNSGTAFDPPPERTADVLLNFSVRSSKPKFSYACRSLGGSHLGQGFNSPRLHIGNFAVAKLRQNLHPKNTIKQGEST